MPFFAGALIKKCNCSGLTELNGDLTQKIISHIPQSSKLSGITQRPLATPSPTRSGGEGVTKDRCAIRNEKS